jgi:hypothetical protein
VFFGFWTQSALVIPEQYLFGCFGRRKKMYPESDVFFSRQETKSDSA